MSRIKTLCLVAFLFSFCSKKPITHSESLSYGSVRNGSVSNAWRIGFKGNNYRYFSRFSYHILGRSWVHDNVYKTVIEAYQTCEKTCPERQFLLMECGKKQGGKLWPHYTHQNGISVDFATPLIKNGIAHYAHHKRGIFHYLMQFTEHGELKRNKKIQIDYNTMATHLLALHKAAKKNGLFIKKVIFKIDLQDNLFASKVGKELKKENIYFVKYLYPIVDKLHDDHYHIDFGFL